MKVSQQLCEPVSNRFFCERARQFGMAEAMAKPSACIHLRWATVSLNAGLAQCFLFCRVEKGLKKATGSGRGICFAKEGGQERSFAKTFLLLQATKL